MRWDVEKSGVRFNSAEYFQKTLITDNGFREYDVRWRVGSDNDEPDEINQNGFILLGKAYGTYVHQHPEQFVDRNGQPTTRVAVGHDFREYSQANCNALIIGLLSAGMHVIDIGMAVSPMLYFSQHVLDSPAGAMVTASHNPNPWTGLKIAKGLSSTFGPAEIQEFKRIVHSGEFLEGAGTYESRQDIFDKYCADCTKDGKLSRPIDVVVATGNGTAGAFAVRILEELGCHVTPVHCDPNWQFPNYNPNPEDKKFLDDIGENTRRHGAAVGLGMDGDGDRLGVVDEQGTEVFSDKMGLLLARHLAPQWPTPASGRRCVVIDVKSTGLYVDDSVLNEHGIQTRMVPTGHSYVKQSVAETGAGAGFERSGHWFFNAPFGHGYDDAVLSAVHVLRMLDETGKSLSDLLAQLPVTWQSLTRSYPCLDAEKYGVVDAVTRQYQTDCEQGVMIGDSPLVGPPVTVNGVRFSTADGSWGLIRASSNLPMLVTVVESPTSAAQRDAIVQHIYDRLKATGKVEDPDQ